MIPRNFQSLNLHPELYENEFGRDTQHETAVINLKIASLSSGDSGAVFCIVNDKYVTPVGNCMLGLSLIFNSMPEMSDMLKELMPSIEDAQAEPNDEPIIPVYVSGVRSALKEGSYLHEFLAWSVVALIQVKATGDSGYFDLSAEGVCDEFNKEIEQHVGDTQAVLEYEYIISGEVFDITATTAALTYGVKQKAPYSTCTFTKVFSIKDTGEVYRGTLQ